MADEVVEGVVKTVIENITESVKNETVKDPATPEGMALAYSSLVIMALVPIFLGSFRSITHQAQQLVSWCNFLAYIAGSGATEQ